MDEHVSGRTEEIIERIEEGQCTLFFGAGASLAAGAPTGDELSNLIIKQFLGQEDWPMSLDHAFSLALANQNPAHVEAFVLKKLSSLKPSPSHKMIPWFKWRALITTNFDQLIELAYKERGPTQRLLPIFSEYDLTKVGHPIEEYVPLLKPHGCVSDPRNMSLGIEGIHAAKNSRRLLFSYIEMLHLAGPVIYIGYSFRDTHIIDMICELKDRLKGRTDMLFVTRQDDEGRKQIERRWFQRTLNVEYLDLGFEGFMSHLSQTLTPAIGPSKIIPQLASCRVFTFGEMSYKFRRDAPGEWDCGITYVIKRPEEYVGIMFQTKDELIDLSPCTELSFELKISGAPRQKNVLEAVKLESYNRSYSHPIDLANLTPGEWGKITINLDEFTEGPGVRFMPLRQVVFTDNGRLASNNETYELGIRSVKFAPPPTNRSIEN